MASRTRPSPPTAPPRGIPGDYGGNNPSAFIVTGRHGRTASPRNPRRSAPALSGPPSSPTHQRGDRLLRDRNQQSGHQQWRGLSSGRALRVG
ncbi:hypothetical protein ACRAWD_30055 [Caulobacter segnis]